jgi:aminoglycoside 6'-N-acetyltransferase I
MIDVTIRRATPQDKPEWFRMRKGIWPEAPDEYLNYDMDEIIDNPAWAVLLASYADGRLVGFLEAHLREYGEGCETSPVGYIEGWYVDADMRGRGIGGALVRAAEDWARQKGCTEMASDTWLDNETSIEAHRKLGYEEVERLVHFRKVL